MACAVETDPINQLKENLQCSVCLEALTDPRTLPCCHSFCEDCLEGVVKTCRDKAAHDGGPIREFPCPDCRTMFTLEADKHVTDMPRNHFICNMVQVAAVLDRGTRVPCSHNCNQSSVARCVTCEKFLCRECLTGHNNYRANDGHCVLTMEELSKPENRAKINGTMYCNEHSGMPLKVYCETCDQLICKDCMDFKHVKQNHSCLLVKDVASNYRELLASNNKTMEDALMEGNDFLDELSLTMAQLENNAENAKNGIVERKDAVLRNVAKILEERAKTLFNKVDEIYGNKREKLDKQAKETKSYVENIKQSVQLSRKLVEKGTEEEIISSQKMMLGNANNLLRKRAQYLKATIPAVEVDYTASASMEPLNEEMKEAMENSLGKVNNACHIDARRPLIGNQPPGIMTAAFSSGSLPGVKGHGSIRIKYEFKSGIQGVNHPNPGQPYQETSRIAYLPLNEEGRKVLVLLRKAFDQKLMFTIGRWKISGKDVIIWNGIHHKTSTTGGPANFGYPDPDYLKRVLHDLAAKGITE